MTQLSVQKTGSSTSIFKWAAACFILLLLTMFYLLPTAHAADVTADELISLVTNYVQDKINTQAGHKKGHNLGVQSPEDETVFVQVSSVPGAPFRFPDQKAVKITMESTAWDGLASNWSDRGIVRIKMTDNSGRSRDIGVPVQVKVQKAVWVVKNTVSANSPLRLTDLSLETRDVSRQYAYVLGSDRDLSPYIARVNLLPGELLDARKLITPPDVRYNDEVRIIMHTDTGMILTVPGVAMSDGKIGQTIRVRQAQFQRKYYTGKITDKNQVEVEL
jgi:flagella basal body P-ring formation protein FlgA